MKNCIDYLRDIQRVKGWSPNKMSGEIGLTSQRVYQLMNEGGTYNDETAYKVARILGEEPMVVMAAAQAERSKNPDVRATWLALLEKISKDFKDLMSRANPRRSSLPAW